MLNVQSHNIQSDLAVLDLDELIQVVNIAVECSRIKMESQRYPAGCDNPSSIPADIGFYAKQAFDAEDQYLRAIKTQQALFAAKGCSGVIVIDEGKKER